MDRCLEILYGYGMVPRELRLLRKLWDQLTMVARAGSYYGAVFEGFWGVTQGDAQSPTIFNVGVDVVVLH